MFHVVRSMMGEQKKVLQPPPPSDYDRSLLFVPWKLLQDQGNRNITDWRHPPQVVFHAFVDYTVRIKS